MIKGFLLINNYDVVKLEDDYFLDTVRFSNGVMRVCGLALNDFFVFKHMIHKPYTYRV